MELTQGVDGVLLALGGYSRYQIFNHVLMTLSSLSASFQLLDMIFIGKMVPHHCSGPPNGTNITIDGFDVPDNSNITYNQCSIKIIYSVENTTQSHSLPCLYGMHYSERKDASFVSEFDLVCDREALSDLPQTLLILGQALGALTLPYFSDKFGRKPTHVISHIFIMVFGIAIAFSPNYLVFAIFRLLIGAVQQGVVLTRTTYVTEIFPTKYRRFMGVGDGMAWTFCNVIMVAIGYGMRFESWRHLQLAYTAAALHVIFQILFVDESFRWLMRNGKYEQALKNIKEAVKMSGANEEVVLKAFNNAVGSSGGDDNSDTDKLITTDRSSQVVHEKLSLLDIFKRKRMARNTVIVWYMWCTAALCYFGLFFTSTSLTGDPHLNVFLNSVMGIPTFIIFWFTIDRCGRKKTALTFYLLGGIGLIIATIVNTTTKSYASSIVIVALSLVGKIGASGAFSTCFFYSPELFPTNIRNIGLGSASVAARTGGMVAPFSRLMIQHIPWGPGAIFGVFCLIATFLVTFLPETKGKQLPQTMADLKLLYPKPEKKAEVIQVIEVDSV